MLMFQVMEKNLQNEFSAPLRNAMKANKIAISIVDSKTEPTKMVMVAKTDDGQEISTGGFWLKQYRGSPLLYLKGRVLDPGFIEKIEEKEVKAVFFVGDKVDIITKVADKKTEKTEVHGTIVAIGRSWVKGPITVKEGDKEYFIHNDDILSISTMGVKNTLHKGFGPQ